MRKSYIPNLMIFLALVGTGILIISFLFSFFASVARAQDLQVPPRHHMPSADHEGHEWLKSKRNADGQSCCSGGKSGDCQFVPFDAYTEDAEGGVRYGKFYFPPRNVFPTEDKKGRPNLCIYHGQPRCAFVPRGA